MPKEHPCPTPATAKYLYAHAFRCAFEGCARPLYRVDEKTGERTLNSTICHIRARSEGGERWDSSQNSEENRAPSNLVIMCIEHSRAIDDPKTASAYHVDLLLEWKKRQVDEYVQLQQGWGLSDTMAEQALAHSFAGADIVIQNSTVHLAGEGGRAPGAGGGGGGAIGPGARAGDGGNGGDVYSALIDLTPEGNVNIEEFRVTVGKGGVPANMPGEHSKPADDTLVELLAKDGRTIHTIRAKGGSGARSSASYLPDGVFEITPENIENGFRATVFSTANSIEFRDGLFFVLGGGWSIWNTVSLPFDASWTVFGTIICPKPSEVVSKGFFLSLHRPGGEEVSCIAITLSHEQMLADKISWFSNIGASFDVPGIWSLKIVSGGYLLSSISVEIFVIK